MVARRLARTWKWHQAMMDEGPGGVIRAKGADSWDKLHEMCARFVRDWEGLPQNERVAYAFPNPEDKPRGNR
jgi:hypothetical protein